MRSVHERIEWLDQTGGHCQFFAIPIAPLPIEAPLDYGTFLAIGSLKPTTAREVLEIVPVEKVIREIFERSSLTLKQRTLADLWDRAYGRPAQSVNVAGGMVHAHTAWSPLEKHSDDEVRLLDKISRKMADPSGSNAPQDGPQNQIESKPAIEVEVMESGTTNA